MASLGRRGPRWREEAPEERQERGRRGWREAWSPEREPRLGRERSWSPRERRAGSWASLEGPGRWSPSSPGLRASVERGRALRASPERPWSRERSWGSPDWASRGSWDSLAETGRAREGSALWSPPRPLSRTPSPPKGSPPRGRRSRQRWEPNVEWEAQPVKRPRWEPQDQSRRGLGSWSTLEMDEEPWEDTKQEWRDNPEKWRGPAPSEMPRKRRRRAGRGHLKRGWSGPRGRGRGWSGPGRAFAMEAQNPQPHKQQAEEGSFHEPSRSHYSEEDSAADGREKLGEWSPESEAEDGEERKDERVSSRKGKPHTKAATASADSTVVTTSFPSSANHSTARAKWVPCKAVAHFWMKQCQVTIGKKARTYLRTTCPRPWLPDRSTQTPGLNKRLILQLKRPHLKRLSYASHKWQLLQNELLDMAAPAMTVYEMAEEALAKGEAVEPLELREWARHLLRYIGSLSQRLLFYRRSDVLTAINPQLRSMATRMNARTANGWLFTEDNMKLLDDLLIKFPDLTHAPLECTRPGDPRGGSQVEPFRPAGRAQPDRIRHRSITEDFPEARPSSSYA
ncbi:uncharacterized protein [Anolis sagrei]|uniref:uncharacterized protein n=1 Tax=Anolis sagrei TaxID=38937 RepID=UPI0035222B1D